MAERITLEGLREQIDEIDVSLLELLNRRASHAARIAEVKQGKAPGDPLYCPERETQVLRNLVEGNNGPLDSRQLTNIFREIMSACLAIEWPLEIGFLGPQGTFTHEAALKHFGRSARFKGLSSIREVFRETEAGTVSYGVVPVENSSEGSVNHTLDLLMDSPLLIVGEVEMRIHHCLLGLATDVSRIKTVYSHQQSFQQCRGWFSENLPGCEQISVNSTADAARYAQTSAEIAAVAGAGVAGLYGLMLIRRNIEDASGNTTRFLVIGNHRVTPSGTDKTSILCSTRNRPGALVRLLQPLSSHGVSMTRIKSRPVRRTNWRYVFFIDVEGHCEDEAVRDALAQLEDEAGFFKSLGSYPRGT